MSITLTPEETRQFGGLFSKYEQQHEGVIQGPVAYGLFIKSGLSTDVLRQIWAVADSSNKGSLDIQGFAKALRMIYHVQHGRPFSPSLVTIPALAPNFALSAQTTAQSHVQVDIPALGTADKARFGTLFDKHARDGLIDGPSARDIFMKAKLPAETLSKIWNLVDVKSAGSLRRNEFILAMHLIQTTMTKQLSSIPSQLPESWIPWLEGKTTYVISPADKQKFDQHFNGLQQDGLISAENAADFLKKSNLSEDVLAIIWDLADFREKGSLDRQGFAIAMFLVNRTLSGGELPKSTPSELIDSAAASPVANTSGPGSQPLSPASPQSAPGLHARTVSNTSSTHGHGSSTTVAAPVATAQYGSAPLGAPSGSGPAPQIPPSRTGASASLNDLTGLDDTFFGSTTTLKSPVMSPTPSGVASKDAFVPKSSFGQSLVKDSTGSGAASSQAPVPAEIKQQHQQAKDQHADISAKLASTQATNKQSAVDLNQTIEAKKALEAEIAELRVSYDREAAQVYRNQQDIKALREEMSQLERDHNLRKSGFSALATQHKDLSTQIEAQRAQRDELQKSLADLEQQHSTHKETLDGLTQESRELDEYHSAHSSRASNLEAELSVILNHIEEAKLARSHAESRVGESKQRADHVEAEVSRARQDLADAQAKAESLAKEAAEYDAKEKAALKQLEELRAQQEKVREANEKAAKNLASRPPIEAVPETPTSQQPQARGDEQFRQTYQEQSSGASNVIIGAAAMTAGAVASAAGAGLSALTGHHGAQTQADEPESPQTSYKGTSTISDHSSPRTSEFQIPDTGAVPPSFTLPMARPQSATSSVANNPPQSVRGDGEDVSRPVSPEFRTSVPVNGINPPQSLEIEEESGEHSKLYAHSGKSSDSFEFVDATDGQTEPQHPPQPQQPVHSGSGADGSTIRPVVVGGNDQDDSSDDEGPEELPHMRSDFGGPVASSTTSSAAPFALSSPSATAPRHYSSGSYSGSHTGGTAVYSSGYEGNVTSAPAPMGVKSVPSTPQNDFGDAFDDLEEAIDDVSDDEGVFQSQQIEPSHPQQHAEPDEWQQLFSDTAPTQLEKPLPSPPKDVIPSTGGGSVAETAALQELTTMGFPESAALEALRKCNFNTIDATNLLLDE